MLPGNTDRTHTHSHTLRAHKHKIPKLFVSFHCESFTLSRRIYYVKLTRHHSQAARDYMITIRRTHYSEFCGFETIVLDVLLNI